MTDIEEISIGAALAREAARQPNKVAVQCEGATRTWRALHLRTNRIARGLEFERCRPWRFSHHWVGERRGIH